MRFCEIITLVFVAYLLIAAWKRPLPRAPRARVTAASLLVGMLVTTLAFAPHVPSIRVVRDWLPGAYMLAGYWLSGLFFLSPARGLESRLAAIDERLWTRLRLDAAIERAPRLALEYLELAYLVCYPLIPAALGALWAAGRSDRADAFWTVVLAAAFVCYAVLPWAATRPPRELERTMAAITRRPVAVRRLNLWILEHASIHANTFPSAHAATAFAAALAVVPLVPAAGVLIGIVAASIAAASVVGRYHYAADAGAGTVVAVLVWTGAWLSAGRW
jgi:hypothetical protein